MNATTGDHLIFEISGGATDICLGTAARVDLAPLDPCIGCSAVVTGTSAPKAAETSGSYGLISTSPLASVRSIHPL